MLEISTPGFNGYAVRYSPFLDSRIALATSANFGLVGNGRLYIMGLTANGIHEERHFDTQDALYDTAWSESHENQVVCASGDGTVKLYDISAADYPIQQWSEHTREVYSVSWNLVSKDSFCSSSWDGTVKVYSPERATSILTLPTHSCTYSSAFSPHSPSIISAVCSDSHLRIFDTRLPASASNHLAQLIPIHGPAPMLGQPTIQSMPPSEILTHDWNKYRSTVIATAGVDTIIRTTDIRQPRAAVAMLRGHQYAVRKLSWSPHLSDVLLSASYDMSCKVWSDGSSVQVQPPLSAQPNHGSELGSMERHTEFCTGVDWCLFGSEGWVASTSWDKRLLVWDIRTVMNPQQPPPPTQQ